MRNLVVAKYVNGELIKGFTRDFSSREGTFHIVPEDSKDGKPREVMIAKLKAVFFVKSTTGNRDYKPDARVEKRKMYGKPISVQFYDGEIIEGYTQVFHPRGQGFFIFPMDEKSNNERIFIVRRAARSIRKLSDDS